MLRYLILSLCISMLLNVSSQILASENRKFVGVHELPIENKDFSNTDAKAQILSQCSALFLGMSNVWSSEDQVNKSLLHSFGEKLMERAVWMKGGLDKSSLSEEEQKLALKWVKEKTTGFHQNYISHMTEHQINSGDIFSEFISMEIQVCKVLLN